MADASGANGSHGVALDVKDDDLNHKDVKSSASTTIADSSGCLFTVPFMQKVNPLYNLCPFTKFKKVFATNFEFLRASPFYNLFCRFMKCKFGYLSY